MGLLINTITLNTGLEKRLIILYVFQQGKEHEKFEKHTEKQDFK